MTRADSGSSHPIGTLNEGPLHAGLKAWYAQPGDESEVGVDGFIIDIVRGRQLVEIQTAGFSTIRDKLRTLVAGYPLRLVYPLAREKWIVRLSEDGQNQIGRRKSPKRGRLEEIFWELVSFPELVAHPNFCLEVLLIQEEEARRYKGGRAWRRRGWITQERRLLQVLDSHLFEQPADVASLLPDGLAEPFTTAELAQAAGIPRRLAQKMAYCLRKMAAIDVAGKAGRAVLYARRAV
ncbi:MAG: hypothetical protein ACP5JJ_11830 [Anaerolineae bacterium]